MATRNARVTSLRSKADFTHCYRTGRRAGNQWLRLYALPRGGAGGSLLRLACPVSRRLGGAVKRNRIRRVLREACRQLLAAAQGDWDVIIVPQPAAAGADAHALRSALRQLLAAVGLG